jgi:putative FmdB family regulatory protein
VPVPVYEYRCRECDVTFEVRRSLTEPSSLTACPSGHVETSRVFTPVGLGGLGSAAGAPTQSGGGCCGGGCCAG